MALNAGQAYVDILPDMSGFGRDLSRGVTRAADSAARSASREFDGLTRDVDGRLSSARGRFVRHFDDALGESERRAGQRFGSTFRGIGRASALAFGAAFAATIGTGILLKNVVGDAGEAARIGRLTEQAVRNTGKAAGLSAKQIARLAERRAMLTGVDDELIQSGANLLLTFKNIRNEQGRGEKVFTRALRAAQDLAAQGIGSLESNSIQLGKALQDPIKGVSALSRAGVTFTEKQRDQIKALVESNDLLGAQRVILHEVEDQVGGAARAAADPMDRLGVVIGNVGERIGARLLPHVEKFADWIMRNMPEIEQFVTDAFNNIESWIRNTVIPAIRDLRQWWRKHKDEVINGIKTAGDVISGFFTFLGEWVPKVVTWIYDMGLSFTDFHLKVKERLALITLALYNWAADMLDAADRALGWIPGWGEKLDKAKQDVELMRIFANAELRKIDKQQKIVLDTRQAREALAAFEARMEQVATRHEWEVELGVRLGGEAARTFTPKRRKRRAMGGPVVAGTGYLVGENGPELFHPNVAGHVFSAQQTQQMSGVTLQGDINIINPRGQTAEESLVSSLKRSAFLLGA